MDRSLKIQLSCLNYFTGFHDLATPGKKLEGSLKCLSYLTGIIPIGVGLTLGATTLYGRFTHRKPIGVINITQPSPNIICIGGISLNLDELMHTGPRKQITRTFDKDYPLLSEENQRYMPANKKVIVNKAKARFEELGLQSNFTLHQFASDEPFRFTNCSPVPQYFYKVIQTPKSIPETQYTSAYYDYAVYDPNKENIWVDFANQWLGGGVLNEGNVQEETMAQETPELLAVCADKDPKTGGTYQTRYHTVVSNSGGKVITGVPTPILIKSVHRVLALDANKLYGDKLYSIPTDKIEKGYGITVLDKPVKYNLLAMAAPRLVTSQQQFALPTIHDLFNTVYAGFSMANKDCMIHSGLIGCGVFGNHPYVAIILQVLAAQIQGVPLYLHGVSDEQMQAVKVLWNRAFNGAPEHLTIHDCLLRLHEALNFKELDLGMLNIKARELAKESAERAMKDAERDNLQNPHLGIKDLDKVYQSKYDRVLNYITDKLNDPEFLKNPQAFVQKWEKKRGCTEEYRFPEDLALIFLKNELGIKRK